jgi:hypothetical protein
MEMGSISNCFRFHGRAGQANKFQHLLDKADTLT